MLGILGEEELVCGQISGEALQILFITEDAAVSVAAVTQATQKTKKSSTRKNMNEETGNYYSEMLKIQKEVALKRMKLLTEKIRNEVMMGRILEKKLMNAGESAPEWSDEEVIGDTVGDEDLTDDSDLKVLKI